MEEKAIRITTEDNPYNPFTQWDQWLLFDTTKGYHTSSRLAKTVIISDQLTDKENYDSVEQGIDELIKYGAINKQGEHIAYKKVYKET